MVRAVLVLLMVLLAGCGEPGEADPPTTSPPPGTTTSTTTSTTAPLAPLQPRPAPAFTAQDLDGCDDPPEGRGAAWADLDGDGLPDLWTGCTAGRAHRNLNDSYATSETMDAPAGATAAWTDLDGDPCRDAAVIQGDEVRVVTRSCAGGNEEMAVEGAVVTFEGTALAAAWSDTDRDGRPDLLVTGPNGTTLVHLDNGTKSTRIGDGGVAVVGSDVDGDRYSDVLVAGDGVQRLRNLANDMFTGRSSVLGLPTGPRTAITTAELDGDGIMDLVAGGEDPGAWLGAGRTYQRLDLPSSGPLQAMHVADMNNDGLPDLVGTRQEGGLVLLLGQGDGVFVDASEGLPDTGTAAVALADADRDGDVDIGVAWADGRDQVLVNAGSGDPSGSWVQVVLHGNVSSPDGVGSLVRVEESGRSWWQEVRAGGSRGQDELVAHFGLGTVIGQIDLIEIQWASGIRQVLAEVDVNVTVPVAEEPTTKTSCPLVFSWDGARMAFESDAMGNAYIGWLFAPGEHWQADPTYRLRLQNDIQPRDGAYEIRLMEALEEIDYLDMARLTAVDHPAEVTMLPDERFMVAGPDTGFGLVPLSAPRTMQAWHDGVEVTDVVAAIDGKMTDATPLPMPRFEGLGEQHVLELELGDVPDGRVQLAGWGWIYYPMTLPLLSAEGPYVQPELPRIEALDPATGEWVLLTEDAGFPVGLPKWWTYALPELPEGASRIRMTTNLLVHWDQLLVDTTGEVPMRVAEAMPQRALLEDSGYPQYVSEGLFNPGAYTYDVISPHHVWDLPEGNYTRLGEVTPLLHDVDDMFVVFKHGDELTLRFDADAYPPVPEGWERTWFLDLDGFFKDMDPDNAFPDTVGPLPFHGMSNYPYGPDEHYPETPEHQAYLAEWNTRRLP